MLLCRQMSLYYVTFTFWLYLLIDICKDQLVHYISQISFLHCLRDPCHSKHDWERVGGTDERLT